MEEQTNLKRVELGDQVVGEIELPKIDITPYIGKKVMIENVTENEGAFGYFVKVETLPLETVGTGDKAIEIKASRIFGLQTDEQGRIGWGKDTNLGVFLAKMGVKHYRELKGKEVIVQSVTNKKDKKDYLTFN